MKSKIVCCALAMFSGGLLAQAADNGYLGAAVYWGLIALLAGMRYAAKTNATAAAK